jgi:hypothetical protein
VPIDTTTPLSPGWWLQRQMAMLLDRRDYLDRLDRYYDGDCDLPEGAQNCREGYRRFQSKARVNFAQLVVDAVRERMDPVAIRTGASGDDESDADAWRIWQANALDADSGLVHSAMLVMGEAYVIVGGVDAEIGAPLITPEDPRQVVAECDPLRPRRVIAATKMYRDDIAGADVAYLYLPGRVFRAFRFGDEEFGGVPSLHRWDWEDAQGTPLPNLDGVVPVVRFANRPKMNREVAGEFEPVMDTLDRINHMLLQRLVIATIQAFRQRAIKGIPTHDPSGQEIDYNGLFSPDPGSLWLLPENADLWESGQVDLGGILQAVRHDVQDLAAATRTPLFYLTPDANNGSAEGASLAREGLIFKTWDRIRQTTESWEQVISLAFRVLGDEQRANRRDLEVLWRPPERFSLAERYDAAAKAQAAGVPWRTVMSEVLQFSPQQVDRMEVDRTADSFLGAPTAPVVPVA